MRSILILPIGSIHNPLFEILLNTFQRRRYGKHIVEGWKRMNKKMIPSALLLLLTLALSIIPMVTIYAQDEAPMGLIRMK